MLAFLASRGILYYEERKIIVFSTPTSPRKIDKLRAEHQAKAKLAAEAGFVPKAFLGDPTFEELISAQTPAPEKGFGLLNGAVSNGSTNSSG